MCVADESRESEKGSITENNDESDNEDDLWKKLKDLAGYVFFAVNSAWICYQCWAYAWTNMTCCHIDQESM